jgi:high-affinity K+ transport system ATPase subunit B
MGTLIGNPAKRASFQQQLFPAGLDLNRCEIHRALGVWKAAAGASFRAGAPVMLNASGEVVPSDGTSILGVAKWDKVTQKRTVVVDAPIVFGTSGATKNLKPNILSSSLQVRSAVEGGGSPYAITTDYTVNLTNGTITHVGGGGISVTATVYVTYARSLTEEELQLEGKNFWQSLDYVTIQDGRIAVVEAPAQIFTTEYDTDQVYALTGANSNVYVNSSGEFTSVVGSNKLVGRCINVPSASDPFLGIEFHGQVVANT